MFLLIQANVLLYLPTQLAFVCSKLTTERIEKGMKHVH